LIKNKRNNLGPENNTADLAALMMYRILCRLLSCKTHQWPITEEKHKMLWIIQGG